MKLKLIEKTDGEMDRYSGIRDAFGGTCELWVDHVLCSYRLKAKNKEYHSRRRQLDARNLQHVIVPEYLDVIDITQETAEELRKMFPDYRHTTFQIWEEAIKCS